MGDLMSPLPFKGLLNWIYSEYLKTRTVFGIPEHQFFRKANKDIFTIFTETCETAIGPAAGPHTQMAQNIVSAYLTGGRFIELKTVQKLDNLQIEKPCIDSRDEGYNTEWSTEFSLKQAFEEYVKAWILLHFLEIFFNLRSMENRSFIFNMSIGYDLEGIKTQGMDSFISGLTDASKHPFFNRCLEELELFIKEHEPLKKESALCNLSSVISPLISKSATLSTMHGCPPEEIESIGNYLLQEKSLSTFIKLNPTLLGYKTAKNILSGIGFDDPELSESSFLKDLQFKDALNIIERLNKKAVGLGIGFGIKLSNTLGVKNNLQILPGDEMYMSGRALYPLTITLASRISDYFNGNIPISFSGGISQLNIKGLFETGIRPITAATDILKPGGYLRLTEMARILESCTVKQVGSGIDAQKLNNLASEAMDSVYYKKSWRSPFYVKIDKKLPVTDCFTAPCKTACPINQDVPEYINLAGKKKYSEALNVIYTKNPLPNITSYICDHKCMTKCTRLDYEGSVKIREIKRIAVENGWKDYLSGIIFSINRNGIKTAVIGAGPAGLSLSYFLSKEGFDVTVFEKENSAGGVVNHIIPEFRIPRQAAERDISFIKKLGVTFKFGVNETFSINRLKEQGFKYIFIGIGAELSKKIILAGDNKNIFNSLHLLRSLKDNPSSIFPGRRVAVIGGGNTAMDSARSAMQIQGVEKVSIIYRRTINEMPADKEELDNAVSRGVELKELLLPESFSKDGKLLCRKMTPGPVDSTGRRTPIPTDDFSELYFDSVVTAIGEHVNYKLLKKAGLNLDQKGKYFTNPENLETEIENVFIGGDAYKGPSTVIESIAHGRKAAEEIIKREFPENHRKKQETVSRLYKSRPEQEIACKKGKIYPDIQSGNNNIVCETESERCLECNILCTKCVDVCPNRANIAIAADLSIFTDIYQIIHIDAFCNECGNCGIFCPYNGKPYEDKLTLFSSDKDFNNSGNNGFIFPDADRPSVKLRFENNIYNINLKEHTADENNKLSVLEKTIAIIKTVFYNYHYMLWI